MPRLLTFRVRGMTCVSCERGSFHEQIPGVMDVTVSVKKSTAVIRLQDNVKDPQLSELNKILEPRGYTLVGETCDVRSLVPFKKRAIRAAWSLAIVGFILLLLQPLRVFVPSIDATASVGALFFFGIVASVSSCLATTGGFMLAYSAKAASKNKTLLMHAGRLTAFAVGGAALGALGGVLPHGSPLFYGIIGLILGIGFLAVALNLLDVSPSLSRFGIHLPVSFANAADRLQTRSGKATPFFVGAATFILPCGFTQTAQALALASGSWVKGSLFLVAFALGTLPVLYGITMAASRAMLQNKTLRFAAGAVMFFFALGQINGGLTLLNSPITLDTFFARTDAVAASTLTAQETEQVVKMDVLSSGYSPDSFTLHKGVPVRWEINGVDVGGCTNEIVSQPLGIDQPLHKGLNVITFTPTQTGTVRFACGMGMVRGTFNVI